MKSPLGYVFNGFARFAIPDYMADPIRNYINERKEPGGFLSAVICNDLSGAIGRADRENMMSIPAIVEFFYNEAPSNCWGSKEKFEAWIAGI